ncbi:hypothetical protein GWK08_03230 [Leptobacterium flavescens]|uniref:Peptidase E n=1 Tax=Leptobacterium flavescens TaxID=472055 RepID=A0A6P0UJ75_9FLAO|nr:DUF6702 family protein [Leptobacterium flavescens]NER12440.1 hypothetical protein [Leptobacterium flavescens]
MGKRLLKSGGLILTLFLVFSFASMHKFYLSVSEVNYSEKDKAIQILSRIFIDDLEDVLEERYEIEPGLHTDRELEDIDRYIARYLKGRILVKINGEETPFNFLGKEYDNDVIKCYIEIPDVEMEDLNSLEIENTVLFELFEEQQNIVHFKIKKPHRSFILIKENAKGLLNF